MFAMTSSSKATPARVCSTRRVSCKVCPALAAASSGGVSGVRNTADVAELFSRRVGTHDGVFRLPEQGAAVLDFLNAKDFDVRQWGPYKQYVEKYANDETVKLCYGWKEVPEVINGRLAMLGFVAAASAEIFGAGSVLNQLAAGSQSILSVMVLISAASIIPIIKGVKGEYLASLRETYTLPEGVFTEDLERVHARLAMSGMAILLFVECCTGTALL